MSTTFPWDIYISPDKVLWATNCEPWTIRNYRPWNFTVISTITHDRVLARKFRNFPGHSDWDPGLLLQSRTWVVYSVPHGTLSKGLRYLVFSKLFGERLYRS
jgi:hypothetical protein